MAKLSHFCISTYIIIIFINLFSDGFSQVREDWIHRYTGPESSTDIPGDLKIDNSGNFYITGKSILSGGHSDIITAKFNSSGVRQWISKYSGPVSQNDDGTSIVTDNSGNIYVCGNAHISSGQYDIVIIKYNQSGVEQWVRSYNGPGNFDDLSSEILFDGSDNVYVGGFTYTSSSNYDFVILKYSLSGNHQWTRTWNSISNSNDLLKKLSLDPNGNVIAAGSSYNSSTSYDYSILKYDQSGNLLWDKAYNGPVSSDDQLTNLKVDLQGNVYVCGRSAGASSGYDYATVKFNSAGMQQWVARYNGQSSSEDGATSLDLDAGGNLYVTGHSFSNTTFFDFATVKYNSSGNELWVRSVNGAENFYDKAVDIKIDSAGNSLVTGLSIKASDGTTDIITVKYNSAGNILWQKTYDGPGELDDSPIGIETDKNGSAFVVANSYSYFFRPPPPEHYANDNGFCGTSDYLILNYSSSGDFVWETRYDGAGSGVDEATAIAVDSLGNCYVSGFSFDNTGNFDYATIKYNHTGVPIWVSRYDAAFQTDKATSVATDGSGNSYVTGSSRSASNGFDMLTIKNNTNGGQFWTARYNGPVNGDDHAVSILTDGSGNVYVAGYSDGTGSGKDYVTVKYNSSGSQLWASRYNGPGNSHDILSSMIIDAQGNVYVTGKSTGSGTSEDIATIKYNSSGGQVWAIRYNGNLNDTDQAKSMCMDQSGNIFVAGKSKTSNRFDMIILKYNNSGVQQWMQSFNGTSNSDDEAVSIVCDNSGSVISSGHTKNTGTNSDYTVVKYNSAGSQMWVVKNNGSLNADDQISASTIDASGNIYVTGFTNDITSGVNYCTVKYDGNGIMKWSKINNYIDNDTDRAAAITIDQWGSVFVTGVSKGLEGGRDFNTIKYIQENTLNLKVLVEARYDESLNQMVPDTLALVLRSSVSPYALVDSSVSVIDGSGNGTFIFQNTQNGINYFLVPSHRNSIETWSAAGQSFQNGTLSYDFTSSASSAFGNNLKQKGSKFCVYSGDVNKDGTVDLSDVATIFNDITVFSSGYLLTDLNGDNVVDLSDLVSCFNNSFNFVSVIKP